MDGLYLLGILATLYLVGMALFVLGVWICLFPFQFFGVVSLLTAGGLYLFQADTIYVYAALFLGVGAFGIPIAIEEERQKRAAYLSPSSRRQAADGVP